MPGVSTVEIIAGTGLIMGVDMHATWEEQFHERAWEIGPILVNRVREKTPILSGALEESIAYEAYPDPGDEDLLLIYPRDAMQLEAWLRIYAPYQEGGALGLATYTNDPREMFMLTATNDAPEIVQMWAEKVANDTVDMMVGGAGIKTGTGYSKP